MQLQDIALCTTVWYTLDMDKKTDARVQALLGRLGLTDNERCVYLHLLERGPGVVAELAGRCHMHRPMIYRALSKFRKLGLIRERTQGKRTLYEALPPTTLRTIVRDISSELEVVLPALITLNKNKPGRSSEN